MPDNDFYRDGSNRLTFEMFRIPANDYPELCGAIVEEFHLSSGGPFVTNGADVLLSDFRSGEQIVGLDWDIWSGFIVTAKTVESEPLVRAIGAWLLRSHWGEDYVE